MLSLHPLEKERYMLTHFAMGAHRLEHIPQWACRKERWLKSSLSSATCEHFEFIYAWVYAGAKLMKDRSEISTPLPELGLTWPLSDAHGSAATSAFAPQQDHSNAPGLGQLSNDDPAASEMPSTSAAASQAPSADPPSTSLQSLHPTYHVRISRETYITYERMLEAFDKAADKWCGFPSP